MPSLADLLTIETSASIFYSYAREVELSQMFGDSRSNSTVLVPTNKAVMALSRKPHQGPPPTDSGVIVSQEEYDSKSKEYVEHWVSAHIVPSVVGLGSYDTLLEGVTVTFKDAGGDEEPEWRRVVVNDDIHIIAKKEASNGVLYMIDGTVKTD
ncbi:hypothetical protein EUX98_g8724 [Antrodiella citrinella]|uniref:FAS1 domain-containing protein n=1 Tax=Antrodiella citrinella TaxID=2447956 RepID=A0A4S4M419_9APHY|nr:hypothetical protein EUX98_g8724 [Antrodiella citrinella]